MNRSSWTILLCLLTATSLLAQTLQTVGDEYNALNRLTRAACSGSSAAEAPKFRYAIF